MANKPFKEQLTPVSPEVVGETIKNALPENPTVLTQKIYIGPNTLPLTTYTVIQTEFPLHIKELIKKCPSVEKLFVPLDEMANAEERTRKKGTLEYRHYENVIKFMSGKGE